METLIALLLSFLIAASGGTGTVDPADIDLDANGPAGAGEIHGDSAEVLVDWSRRFR